MFVGRRPERSGEIQNFLIGSSRGGNSESRVIPSGSPGFSVWRSVSCGFVAALGRFAACVGTQHGVVFGRFAACVGTQP